MVVPFGGIERAQILESDYGRRANSARVFASFPLVSNQPTKVGIRDRDQKQSVPIAVSNPPIDPPTADQTQPEQARAGA
jgi:hypothetical protein